MWKNIELLFLCKYLSASSNPCWHIWLNVSGCAGNSMRVNRYRFDGESAIDVFTKFTWNKLNVSSCGQMSDSPENGETVTVCSSIMGKLSLKPPSIYATPWNFGGTIPDQNGMKHEHWIAYQLKFIFNLLQYFFINYLFC